MREKSSTIAVGHTRTVGNFVRLSGESILRLYESIRRQVDANELLGEKYRLVGVAARDRAERLKEELPRRGMKFTPIVW